MIFTFTYKIYENEFFGGHKYYFQQQTKQAQAATFENSWSSIVTLLLDMITRY